MRTLTFGMFPKDVLEFQESQDFFQQITFIDYQLQLLIQNEFQGQEFAPVYDQNDGYDSQSEKLVQLIDYAISILANYNDQSKSYRESLYYVTVIGQLFYLNNQPKELSRAVGSIHVTSDNNNNVNGATGEDELLRYLTCRYKVLQGISGIVNEEQEVALSGPHVWNEYLLNWNALFSKSNVAANRWLDFLFDKFTDVLTADGLSKLEFHHLRQQDFATNHYSLISLSNYLSRHSNKNKVTPSFKQEYSSWLSKVLEVKMLDTRSFPNALQNHQEINTFVDNLYESLCNVLYYHAILKPELSKKFLVSCTTKTYQSQVVICNLVKTLISLNEFDEAYAAMKTYIQYLHIDQEQKSGYIDNILSIIDTYTACILAFNPLDSFINSTTKKFKYTTKKMVVEMVEKLSGDLIGYLGELKNMCDLTYDDDDETDELSFLFKKYNLNVLLDDRSNYIDLVSKAWYSLGRFYEFMSTYEAATEANLELYTGKLLQFYKNGLIVNSTGNSEILFNYALCLAYNRSLLLASKLCKFILKKYPESFKTWNLLVLLLTLFELHNPDHSLGKSGSNNATTAATADTTITTQTSTTINRSTSSPSHLFESEKFVNNALNIAALFIEKYNKSKGTIKLSFETKYYIIQLKLTQCAILESIYGVDYILEALPEVFGLFHELFDQVLVHSNNGGNSENWKHAAASTDNAWSHRPSFIDPAVNGNGHENGNVRRKKSNDIEHISEKLKSLSKTASHHHKTLKTPERRTSTKSTKNSGSPAERKLLQDLWLWASSVYSKIGNLDQAEECIVEAETVYELNVKTFSSLGYLTSKSRKFLSLQEFEKALEILAKNENYYNRKDFMFTLLGLCKLFMIDDQLKSSLFISATDLEAGIIRLKNYLEKFTLCWPHGHSQPEVWWYLSLIYERIDDKILLNTSLWKCIDLEDYRPVRDFSTSVIES